MIMLRIAVILMLLLVQCSISSGEEIKEENVDNEILTQVLRNPNSRGKFTVVEPEAYFIPNPTEAEELKQSIKDKFARLGHDFSALVDLFFYKNRQKVTLRILSSPADGFLIDYEGKFKRYFDSGHCEALRRDHPEVSGNTHVSLPAYDKEKSIVLVAVSYSCGSLYSSGGIVAYEYKNRKLKKLCKVILWKS